MKKTALLSLALALLMCMSLVWLPAMAEAPADAADPVETVEVAGPVLSFDLTGLKLHAASADGEEVESLTLFKNKNLKLKPVVTGAELPKGAKFTYKTSDAKVAALQGATVTGKGLGLAEITCSVKLADGTEVSGSIWVDVQVAVTQMKSAAKSVPVCVGMTANAPEITVSPAGACADVIWSSADESIATVTADGVITGVKAGSTKLTATSAEDTAKPKTVVITVTVNQPVETITLNQSEGKVVKNGKLTLTAAVVPETASVKKVTWTSSDPKVAAVQNGVVTGKGPGIALITCAATDGSGVTAVCTVEVVAPITGASLNAKTLAAFTGMEPPTLTLTVAPEGVKYYDVVWTSSDENVVKVDATGALTVVGGGKATITATVTSNVGDKPVSKKAECVVTVTQPVEKISISGADSIKVPKGQKTDLTATVTPSTASNPKVVWASSNPKVASVSAKGQVQGKSVGKATITCTAADGSGTVDSIDVDVYQQVTSIKANAKKVGVTKGKTAYLYVTVGPDNAANKKVTWSSSNTYVATVDSNGKVTAKNTGETTITATSVDNPAKSVKFTVYTEPVVPLDATGFTKRGVFGLYDRFAITFKNLTKTRTIKYISFDVKYDYLGKTYTAYSFYDDSPNLGPGREKKIGWWDSLGYPRTYYAKNVRVYLRSVRYNDGTTEYWSSGEELLGWFK